MKMKMKKKILTTLLIGATLGTGISALSTSSVNACSCRLTRYETIADNLYGARCVDMIIDHGKLYKKYPTANRCCTFIDCCGTLYCTSNITGQPVTGLFRDNGNLYYFKNGVALSGTRTIDGVSYCFDATTYKGHRI